MSTAVSEPEVSSTQVTPRLPSWYFPALYMIAASAMLIRIFYWAYTGRTWDDALITVLHSENAASGLGLTHVTPGEPPLHGFTSPLSVLIPLLGDLVHVGYGLLLLKAVSVVFGAIAAWLGARISVRLKLPPALALTVAAFLALDHHQILWGMAGMETQVVTVAYLYSIDCMQRRSQWSKGLSFGFVMLARPDAAIWVSLASAVEVWRAAKQHRLKDLLPVGAGLTILYAPWLMFTFLYYGSPVPNTIHAKSLGYPTVWMQLGHRNALQLYWAIKDRFYDVLGSLGPGYQGNGGSFVHAWDHRLIAVCMTLFLIIGAIVALKKRNADALLVYGFVLSYTLYLALLANLIFGWYSAPVVAAAVIGSFYGFWQCVTFPRLEPYRSPVAAAAGFAYILCIVAMLPATIQSDRAIQKYVEDGGRKQLGLYLASVASSSDTIGSESLGYVGYYSRRTIDDYPGLCNRKVVNYLRDHPSGRNMLAMMQTLHPTYLVLRPREYVGPDGKTPYAWLDTDYELVRVFKVPDSDRLKILDSAASIDFEFDVFRRKPSVVAPAA